MKARKQIICAYQGYVREICPTILGHTDGKEKAFAFQFAGGSKSGLPPRGEWRCLFLGEVSDVHLRDGPWHTGGSHKKAQSCVAEVDLDVNPDSPYNPKRPMK
jgi:hypothetical protein